MVEDGFLFFGNKQNFAPLLKRSIIKVPNGLGHLFLNRGSISE
jgi:hypothetical protein